MRQFADDYEWYRTPFLGEENRPQTPGNGRHSGELTDGHIV